MTAGDREPGIDRPQVAFAAVVGERHVQVGGEGQDLGFPVAEEFEQAAGLHNDADSCGGRSIQTSER